MAGGATEEGGEERVVLGSMTDRLKMKMIWWRGKSYNFFFGTMIFVVEKYFRKFKNDLI